MIVKITFEWNIECGVSANELFPLTEAIETFFLKKNYGNSVAEIFIVLTCRPYDFKQRKKLKKASRLFSYDIILDYFLIRHTKTKEEKVEIICKQIIEISQKTFSSRTSLQY